MLNTITGFANLPAVASKNNNELKETNLEIIWTKYSIVNWRLLVIASACPLH